MSALTPVVSKIRSAAAMPRAQKSLDRRELPAGVVPFAVYFSDAPQGLYQIEQWLKPLRALSLASGPVALIVGNPLVALRLLDLTDLPIVLAASSAAVERFVQQHSVEVIFYVNNNQANFTTLRISGPAHVHLSHGESEKSSMTSNQLKVYDFCFIAGQASAERILSNVPRFDPAKLVYIGRPQLDMPSRAKSDRATAGQPISVLYAPTWEGDSPSMAYGSLADLGANLVHQILLDPRFRLTYRPHPKLGTLSFAHRSADKQLRESIKAKAHPHAMRSPLLDENRNAIDSISKADLVVTDISAMAMDSIAMNKNTLILLPDALPEALTRDSRVLDAVPHWSALPARPLEDLLHLAEGSVTESQKRLRDHIFGTADLGSGTVRFIAASIKLLSHNPMD